MPIEDFDFDCTRWDHKLYGPHRQFQTGHRLAGLTVIRKMTPIFEVVPDKTHRPIFATIWDVDQTGVPFFLSGNWDVDQTGTPFFVRGNSDSGAPLKFIFLSENDAIVAQGAISVARET